MKESWYEKIGEIYKTYQGYTIEVVEFFGVRNCTIKFNDKHETVLHKRAYGCVKKGIIKNPFHPTTYGVGYLGIGKYKFTIDGKQTTCTEKWRSLLGRCYSEKQLERNDSYKYITVCKEWKCFQNFAEWFENNWKPWMDSSWDLDKDILVKGNKAYSPETCCFVPKEINVCFTKRKSKRGNLPIGVTKIGKKFQATLQALDNPYLGIFDTPEEAFQAYKIAKEAYIKEVADKWRGKITEECYQAMYNWVVEITD